MFLRTSEITLVATTYVVFRGVIQEEYLVTEVVGWCEGAVYLTSPGRPTDIGLQLGKACYPCSG